MTRKSFFACLLGIVSTSLLRAQAPLTAEAPLTAQRALTAEQKTDSSQQNSTNSAKRAAQQPPDEDLPPEEDESAKPRTYAFDPLEADRNIKIGNFYMHKASLSGYRAAAGRYEDATRYNPNSAEAFFKLGEAEEKLKDKEKAKAAFQRAIRIAPDSKFGKEARKKLAALSS